MRNPTLLGTMLTKHGPGCPNCDITLRDLAAIAAMQAMLASPSLYARSKEVLALYSTAYADALLAELEKKP